ncbi:MAG: signal peptide peptidase SppA [Treponema sp.]|nr:signal peptide peptidase SppA [Treponema sp.]
MWQFDKPFSSQFKFNKRSKSDYIAVLYIKGVIESKNKTYNQSWLLSTIQDLTEDPKNKAIMLYINSPGGGVYEADAVYLALEDYKTKTSKPVFAYLGPLAASGGYYIACAATTIFANRNTLTGSIGVISGSSIDATRLMDKLGITMTTITAGRNKNMGNYNEPFNDEQKAIMQSIADEAYDQFTSIVASSRKMPLKQVHVLADGRIYSALQAKNNGLIDQVCSWEDALAELKKEENVGNCTVEPFKVEEKTSFYEYVKGAVSSIATISAAINKGKALDLLIRNLHNNQPVLQYLYQQ